MHNSKIKRISLAVCLAFMPFAASAAGLGKLTVFSGLGEPLNAEIELSASKEELSSLSASIAPAEIYTEQGLERPASLSALKVELGKRASGAPVIKLTSAQPVNDPFLDMLIQMEWSTGRLLREYTALLDPPGYGEQKTTSAVAPQVSSSLSAGTAAATKPIQKTGKAHKATSPSAAGREQAAQGDGYTTKSGDTLLGVARQMQVEGVSLEQMLVGLYRANKDAFVDGNMNRMKVGQIMRAPDSEELQAVSQQEAVKEVRVHTTDWHAYRNKLAGAVAESVSEGEGAQGQSVSGKITAPAEDKAAPAAAGPRDVVKLSKSDTAPTKPGAPETTVSKQDKANASKEDSIARDKAVKEADERVALLEKQLQEMQKLLQVKNQALAEMQKAPASTDKAQPPAPAAEVSPPAPKAEVAPTASQPPEAKPSEPTVAAEAPKKPRKPREQPPVVAPEPEPDLMDDPLMMGAAGGGLVALLGVGWLYLRNKRKKGLDSFEQGLLTTSGLKPNTVFGNTAGGMVDTGDTSFLTDLSQGSGGMIDTSDVDPIAEAEVYMAYGRDVQAEEILKDAITKDPRRYDLHQKLLEIYSNRKDVTAFETLASELYSTLGAADPNWQKFAAMGRALEPANPLYSAEVLSAATAQNLPSETQDFSSVFNTSESDQSLSLPLEEDIESSMLEFTESPVTQDNSLDLDLGDSEDNALTEAAVEENVASQELDFDIGAELPDLSAGGEDSSEVGLDFNFDLPEPAIAENIQLDADEIGLKPEPLVEMPELSTVEPAASLASETDVEGISFDLPDFDLETPQTSTASEMTEAALAEVPDMSLDLHAENLATLADVPSLDISEVADEVTGITTHSNEPVSEEIEFDAVPEENAALDFDFEVEMDETPAMELPPVAALGLPDLNLSGISLDLDEPEAPAVEIPPVMEVEAAAPEAVQEVEEIAFSADESADVDTKLDLVAAYMDMGDTEGARELMEEVLREGGPQQRERAQAMLASLG